MFRSGEERKKGAQLSLQHRRYTASQFNDRWGVKWESITYLYSTTSLAFAVVEFELQGLQKLQQQGSKRRICYQRRFARKPSPRLCLLLTHNQISLRPIE